MYEENGFAYQLVVLIVIIVIAITGVAINKTIGKNGVASKVVTIEDSFTKNDVLEKINHIITQKFIELNNQAKESNQTIADLYNSSVVIEYLKESSIIEEIYNEDNELQEGIFKININKLNEDDSKNAKDENYRLEKREDSYVVIYHNADGTTEDIGELQIQQM